MTIGLVVIGASISIYGILKFTGAVKEDLSKDSEFDKKFLSERHQYFVGRYWAGSMFIIAGFGAMALGLILWFSK
jgi:hypothetical protein